MNENLLQIINDFFLNKDKEAKFEGEKNFLLYLLENLSSDLDLDSCFCALFGGGFTSEIDSLINEKSGNLYSCKKISILLQNEELSKGQLVKLAKKPILTKLSCRSLIKSAETLSSISPIDAFNFLKASILKISNLTLLAQAKKTWHTIKNEKSFNLRFPQAKIAVGGNCTLKPLADYIEVCLPAHNIDADVFELPYDQWVTQILDLNSELYQFNPSFFVLYLSSLGLTNVGTNTGYEAIEILDNCLDTLKSNSSIQVVMILPEPLEEGYFASSELFNWHYSFLNSVIDRFQSKIVFVDPTQVITEVGRTKWYGSTFWYHAKLPCHPNALISLGKHVSTTLANCFSLPVKVIVCDLDNTIWGGIVGEDGVENISLDVHSSGGPFIRLQNYLKSLTKRGVILVAVSKNNEKDVREVFFKREEMVLKWDDFLMVIANWEAKSENISFVAGSLNLSLEHFCFIDDSPFERAEVKKNLPAVIVPELPGNPEEFVSFLVNSGLFHIPFLTLEDTRRIKFYRDEIVRADAKEKSTGLDSFLSSLELKLYPFEIGKKNIQRVVQLLKKTNQFNLTTRRHDYDQVSKFSEDRMTFSCCYQLEDIFGDSGISGIIIAKPLNDDSTDVYLIDTWLLSCRVMGRTVELGMFEHLSSWLKEKKVEKLIGEYIPTKKNKPVEGLYEKIGFQLLEKKDTGDCLFQFDLNSPFEGNKYVELVKPPLELKIDLKCV